jgi:pyrroline-5-carboxylate reductase
MSERAALAFIGAGNMATAFCRGVVADSHGLPAEKIIASDPDPDRRAAFEAATAVRTTPSNVEACRAAVVVLAVKPQVMPAVLVEIGPLLGPDVLVITIAAGVPTAQVEAAAPGPVRVVRVMPNTAMLVTQGAAGICAGRHATDDDLRRTEDLLGASCAIIARVSEDAMHAVTALSGSGPAYAFFLAELMARAGTEMGLDADIAADFAAYTIQGAGAMLVETGEPPGDLRRKVTSPGGTTETALRSMNEDGVGDAIVKAIHAACARSKELAGDADDARDNDR